MILWREIVTGMPRVVDIPDAAFLQPSGEEEVILMLTHNLEQDHISPHI